MEFIIDDANIDKIKKIWDIYPCDGVTTNPSILANNKKDPYTTLKEIREFIGANAQLHVQVVANDYEGMIKDADAILKQLGSDTYIKVPTTSVGLKVMKELNRRNINITATAIYSPMQGYLAAKAGADYVAPYINRIDNLGFNGIETAKIIHDILKNNNMETKVLAASFKNSYQVQELCAYGIGASTIGCDIIEGLLTNASVDKAVKVFEDDFKTLCGEDKTMSNCL